MNFPSAHQDEPSNPDFEQTLDEAIEPESESTAKPATAILVIIPRGSDSRSTSTVTLARPAWRSRWESSR